jgi:NAD(P)-dependent dehydrogenase (short-subunit alcohol dehydrogenase family)
VTANLVVVAGATGTIGRGVVVRLLAEGRTVLALGRDGEALDAMGDHPHLERLVHDVTGDPATVRATVGDRAVLGVVHTAGGTSAGSILHVTPDAVHAAIDVKVVGLLQLVRGVSERLGRHSRIIAVGGNLGFDPTPAAATPGLGNAAQAAAIRQLNRALAPRGVTCHTLAPGPVESPRFDHLVAAEAARRGVDPSEARASLLAASPLGRATTVEELAWAVSRLLEPEADALGGSTWFLDTGRRTALP